MYEQRNYILEHDDVHSLVQDMFKRVISDIIASNANADSKNQEIDTKGVVDGLNNLGFKDIVTVEDLQELDNEQMVEFVLNKAWTYYDTKIDPVRDRIQPIEKEVSLSTIDRAWSNHIDTMEKLRTGIGLRSYASNNPLQAYVEEGYELFQDMMQTISQEIVTFCMNVKVVDSAEEAKEA